MAVAVWVRAAGGLGVVLEDSHNIVIVQPRGESWRDVRVTVTDVEALREALADALVLRDVAEGRPLVGAARVRAVELRREMDR